MSLQESYKEARYKNKMERENLLWIIIGVFIAVYYIPDWIDIGIKDKLIDEMFSNPVDAIKSHYKYFLYYISASLSLYLYLFFNPDWKFLQNKKLQKYLKKKKMKGFFVDMEDILYPKTRMVDGVEREELNIFKDVLTGDDPKKLLFGSHHKNIEKCFRKDNDKDFMDVMKVIENSFKIEKDIDEFGNISHVGKYDILDNESSWDNFRAEKIVDGEHKILFSVNALKELIEVGAKDFLRYYNTAVGGKPTVLQKQLFKNDETFQKGVINDKAVLIFKFLIFHKIINSYTGLSVGFLNSRLLNVDLKTILSIYDRENTTIVLERRNDGSDRNFNSDVFASHFLIVWHYYFKNTMVLNWDLIFKNFNPQHSAKGGLIEDRDDEKNRVKKWESEAV